MLLSTLNEKDVVRKKVLCPVHRVKHLIGSKGSVVNKIMTRTGAGIVVEAEVTIVLEFIRTCPLPGLFVCPFICALVVRALALSKQPFHTP